MAAKKVWLRTNGLTDEFVVGDVKVTRSGTLIDTDSQAKEIEELAAASGIPVTRMDDAPVPTPEDEQVVRADPGAGVAILTDQEDGK